MKYLKKQQREIVQYWENGVCIKEIDLSPVRSFERMLEKSLAEEYNLSVLENNVVLKEHNIPYFNEQANKMDSEQLNYIVNYLVTEIIKRSRGELILLDGKERGYKRGLFNLSEDAKVNEFESELEKELDENYVRCVKESTFVLGDYDFCFFLEKARDMGKNQLKDAVSYLIPKLIECSRTETRLLFDERYQNEHKTKLKNCFEFWRKIHSAQKEQGLLDKNNYRYSGNDNE
ncbi:MAG: hypothetical protein PHW96_02950 [Candidatus Nanoarchaeia archaeon]|nr:hypothetical protein [Candidatus Nanoarchaeia archaeon]